MTTKLTAETITDSQINALWREAAQAGDDLMCAICKSALSGQADEMTERHREQCAVVINDAAAQE